MHIRSFTLLLIAIFSFSSVISACFSSYSQSRKVQPTVFNKKTNDHSKADIQIAYEEREKEEETSSEDKSKTNLVFIYIISEELRLSFFTLRDYYIAGVPRFCGSAANIPLYLAKKTLLI
jgi:hypothetical protein